MPRPVRRAGLYARAVGDIRRAGRNVYGTGWLRMYGRAVGLRRRHGFALDESLGTGLLDPGRAVDPEVASKREATAVQTHLNPAVLEPLLQNKLLLYMTLHGAGVPVPPLLATLVTGATGWSWVTDAPVPAHGWAAALEAIDGDVVVKPADGYHGVGVRVLGRDGTGFLTPDGRRLSAGELADEVAADRAADVWVVQRRVRLHRDMPQVGRPGVVNTCRVVTFVDTAGLVHMPWVGFRIGAGTRGVDNFEGGRHGNLSCRVDPATGELLRCFGADATRPGFTAVDRDPVSGRDLAGLRLPVWDEVRALADRTARTLLPARTLGLDVAITPEGPQVLEVNPWWDPVPHEPMRPVLEHLRTG